MTGGSTAEAGDVDRIDAPEQPKKKKKPFRLFPSIEILKPGTTAHNWLWTYKTGRTLGLINAFFTFVVPLHGIEKWSVWAILPIAAIYIVVAAWYPSSQSRAVKQATDDQGAIDPNYANKDYGWSLWPYLPMLISFVLTLVAYGLLYGNTHVFDSPASSVVWDRMVMSPAMVFINFVTIFMVKVDVGTNNSVLAEMAQIAGRITRYEHRERN